MKKSLSYRDQLIELARFYKISEIRNYFNSRKKLTTSQIELILLKNKVRLPEHSYNKKKNSGNQFQTTSFNQHFPYNIFNNFCYKFI